MEEEKDGEIGWEQGKKGKRLFKLTTRIR